MEQKTRVISSDLAIIGSGMAGFAASIFALNRGINTVQAGNTGAIAYTTGYLDLLGCVDKGKLLQGASPWQGIEKLASEQPQHPLTLIPQRDVAAAFEEFTGFLGENGIAYSAPGKTNVTALTPAGTLKPTYSVPKTMQAGVDGYAGKNKAVLIDFKGLRGFSARQVVANLQQKWSGIRAERVAFPGMEAGEIYPEVMARALEVPKTRELLAQNIRPLLGDAQMVGMPAVLGMHNPDKVMEAMEQLLGVPLFEIPTMPPSVPGIRLREMFEQVFPQKGLTLIPQQKIKELQFEEQGIKLFLADNYGPIIIKAKAGILATGRFLSGGLHAGHDKIEESLLNIPVIQPECRDQWYEMDYMDINGHGVHKAGIEVDSSYRPLDRDHRPINDRLFAAGIVLAHQDWIRDRCGAGLAIATAYKAVEATMEKLGINPTI